MSNLKVKLTCRKIPIINQDGYAVLALVIKKYLNIRGIKSEIKNSLFNIDNCNHAYVIDEFGKRHSVLEDKVELINVSLS